MQHHEENVACAKTRGTWVLPALPLMVLAAAGAYLVVQRTEDNARQAAAAAVLQSAATVDQTDPRGLHYVEGTALPTGMQEPRALAAGPNGSLYVAGDLQVRALREDGTPQGDFPLPDTPHCLAVSPQGLLYVGLRDHVEVYDRQGHRQATWPSRGPRGHLTSLAVAGGSVWVADAGGRLVLRYDLQGRLLGTLGGKDGPGGLARLIVPSPHLDVAVGADGLLRVVNPGRHTINVLTTDGQLKASWGQRSAALDGFCGCCNPTDIALLPDGRVVTSEKGIFRVKVYTPQGQLQSVVAGPEAFRTQATGASPTVETQGGPGDGSGGFAACLSAGLDLAVDARGRVLVLDPSRRAVRVFAPKKAG